MAVDDADLVLAARSGDRAAWAGIYDRYADRLHDFCWSVLRDREEAADATHDTFITAYRKVDQLRDPSRLRPWLFAIARNEALAHARKRSRVVPSEEFEVTASGPTPDQVAETEDVRQLVWAAAAGLADRDRAALDLHLRQGLEGAALGEALGLSASNANVVMSRLRDQVERALGAYVVARRGRSDCNGLDALLQGWDEEFTPLWRKRIARHVDDCPTCGENRKRLASPLALLAGIAVLPAPTHLRDRVLRNIDLISTSKPITDSDRRQRRLANIAVVVALLFLLGAIASKVFNSSDDGTTEFANATSDPTFIPPPTSPMGDTTVGSQVGGVTVTTTRPGGFTTTTTGKSTPTTARPGGGTVVTPTTAPGMTTTTLPPVRVSASSRSTSTCSGQSVPVTATVTGGNGDYNSVRLFWQSPSAGTSSAGMNPSGSNWTGNMTPTGEGRATWWVVATDSAGNTGRSPSQSIGVTVCPQ